MDLEEIKIGEEQRAFLAELNGLDFGPLAYKLMNPEDRPGMSLEMAIDAIEKYKGFLFLYHSNPGKSISPSRYVDYVWHTHIMDTELYFVQTALLFGHYLHHFPFFGKRGSDDEGHLLEAAEFTKSQALRYFGWDDDGWCGTGRKPHFPRPHANLGDLARVILPAGINADAMHSNPDIVTIQTGNFRHTVEHLGSQRGSLRPWSLSWSDQLSQILKLPIWVIVCMPVVIDRMNEISVIQRRENLPEISKSLVEKRLSPEGFSGEMVKLRVGAPR